MPYITGNYFSHVWTVFCLPGLNKSLAANKVSFMSLTQGHNTVTPPVVSLKLAINPSIPSLMLF